MDLDGLIIGTYCVIDDGLKAWLGVRRLRQRGPQPVLADSEVLTMEVVGEYLGWDRDTELYSYFRRHYSHFFPALCRVHRTTFVRQAANLWRAKEYLWQLLLGCIHHDPVFALVDSFPLPVCQFARAPRCERFRGDAAFGKDTVLMQTFYGFRVHVRLSWPGVITRFSVAPANISELAILPELTEATYGWLVGDRNYWSPRARSELSERGVQLLAPYRQASADPTPHYSTYLSRLRYRIDTVFGQLTDRYCIKRVWARDWWHLASRLLRKILSHTMMFLLGDQSRTQPLQIATLLSA